MEEKIYFKPVDSKKKEANRAKGGKSTKKKENRVLLLGCLLLFLLFAIVLIAWLLHGKTTTQGGFPENRKNAALVCSSTELTPEKLKSANSSEKEIRINAIFNGTDGLKSISLIYTLNYASPDEAYGYEAKSHAEFNKTLNALGYSNNMFKNKFSRYNNQLIISLSANYRELDQTSAPFFMVNVDDSGKLPETLDDYEKNFVSQGFSCETNSENN